MFVISTLNPEAAVCQKDGEKVDGRRLAVIARPEAPEIQIVLRCSKALLLYKMTSLSWTLKLPHECEPDLPRQRAQKRQGSRGEECMEL